MSDHYTAVLLEDMNHKFDVILESLSLVATKEQVKELDVRVGSLENKVDLLTLIVKEEAAITRKHTSTLNDHELRISDLEDEDNLDYA